MTARRRSASPPGPREPRASGATAGRGAVAAAPAAWLEPRFVAAVALLAGVLLALHGPMLGWPFLSDDFLFLTSCRDLRHIAASFDLFPNYFRPVSRELFFFLGLHTAGNRPLPYHLVNFAVLVAIVAMVVTLGRRLVSLRAGILAGAAYVVLYPMRILMAWVSCSQDLLATAFGLAATHAWLSRRRILPGALYFVALFAKESVVPLPALIALLAYLRQPASAAPARRARVALRETAGLWIATAAWAAIVVTVRVTRHVWAASPTALADVSLEKATLWEGLRSALLAFVALDQPGVLSVRWTPPWIAMALLVGVAALLLGLPRSGGGGAKDGASGRVAVVLGAVWAFVGVLPSALVGHHFNSYYITFAGVGWALAFGVLAARLPAFAPLALLLPLSVMSVAANQVDVFNLTREETLAGASYITVPRFDLERRILDSLQTSLERARPPRGAIAYLSNAPHYMSFVTSVGRAPRIWLDDPSFDLETISQYTPAASTRPRLFLRYDIERRSFVAIPQAAMDASLAADDAMAKGDLGEARAQLARAIQGTQAGVQDAFRAEMFDNLGLASFTMGDTAGARMAWQAAVAIHPDSKTATAGLAQLASGDSMRRLGVRPVEHHH